LKTNWKFVTILIKGGREMKIAICAKQNELKILKKLTINYCLECNCYPVIDEFENRESIIEAMTKSSYAIVIVAIERAKGMEIVKHVHRGASAAKIIWFSDDKDFAGFAFENGVKKFELFPINYDKLADGLSRCGIFNSQTDLCRVHLKPDH
jgi:two-component SAPR family response regulator